MRIYGTISNAATGDSVVGARVMVRIGGREVATSSGSAGEFEWRDDGSHVGEMVELTVEEAGFEPWRTSREIATTDLAIESRLQPVGVAAPAAPRVEPSPTPPEVGVQSPEKRSIPLAWWIVGVLILLVALLGLYCFDRQAAEVHEPEPEPPAPYEYQ